jgi:hypothetical protein
MTDASSDVRFRLRLVPILVVIALGFGVPTAGATASAITAKLLHWHVVPGANLPWMYLQHTYQLIVALIFVAIFKFWLVPADYGLHWPRGKTYIWPAILWGTFFAVLMALVDYAPNIIAHTKPDLGFPPTSANVWGWTFFEGIYVGPTEEIPFRALLVTYLAVAMPGKLRLGRFDMNWAGVIVAVIFALAHISSFWSEAWQEALLQQVYAFGLGVLYAYWLEKSKSIVAPMIGHNVSDVVEYIILFVWLGVFSF